MSDILTRLQNQINNNNQTKSELTFVGNTGIGESQYDAGINPESLNYINNLRANRQGHWDSFANMLVRGAGKAVLTIPESLGYLFDLPEVIGAQRDFDNVLSNWARSQKEALDESLPEYSRYTEEGGEFNPLDREFYWRGGDSVIESLGYLVPGFGVGGATARGLSLLGRLSPTVAKGLGKTASFFGSTVPDVIKGASALTAATATNYIESMQVAGETYRDLISKGVDPEIAAKEAKDIIWQGKVNIALELPQYLTLFRGFNTSRAMKGADNSFVKFKAKDYAMQMGSEAIEELGLDFIAKDNERDALIQSGQVQPDNSNFLQRFVDYATSDEGLTAAFLGALGGVAFQGFGDVIKYTKDTIKKDKTESQKFSEAVSQINQNTELLKSTLKENASIFQEQQEAIKNNDPVAFNSLQRTAFKNLAFSNALKGTYSQFLDTLDSLSTMNQEEASKLGLNSQEVAELSQVFKKDAKIYESLFNQSQQLSNNPTIQQDGFNILADKYLADNTISNAQTQINKIYSENTSNTFGPTKQRVNKLVNQKEVYNKFINAITETEGPKSEFKQFLQKKLGNINQQIQQEIENLNTYVDSEFTTDEYAKIRGKKLTEQDFKNSLVDSQIQQQEKNLIINQFQSLKAQEEFNNLSNPKVQEQIIKQEEEVKAEQIKQAEKEATKALTDEFNELVKTPETNLARLEEINNELKGTAVGKDLNLKLNKIKSDLNKKAKQAEVITPAETTVEKTTFTSVDEFMGVSEDNTIVATSDSSNTKEVNKQTEGYKERKKSENKSGAYLDLEYIESPDGSMIASLKDDNGNVIPVERMIKDSNDYSKYPPGTKLNFVIDENWKNTNNIANSNWWELPIAMQIDNKTLVYVPAFKSEPKDNVIDENIKKKYAESAQERIQKELIAERKYLAKKLLAGEIVTGKITDYGTGAIDGYTQEQGEVINRLGNGTSVFKDIQFAVVDKGAAQFKLLTQPSNEFYVDNNLVTSEHFSGLPNGSVVVLLPSYARNSNNQNELIPRAIDRINLSEQDVNIVLHLIETYGKYNSEAAQKAIGLNLPEGTKNVTEYLINNYVYSGGKNTKGNYFEVETKDGKKVIKIKDSTGAVDKIIPVNENTRESIKTYLKTLKYNIHSNPYFKLDFDGQKITKAEPLDSRNVIAQRTKTNIDNTTFTIINSAENKMQIFRQPAIYYSIDKPVESKKAPKQKKAVKKEAKLDAEDFYNTFSEEIEQSRLENIKAEQATIKVSIPQAKYNAIINANEKTIPSVLKAELGTTDLFRKFNKAFKASGITSKLEFAKQYFQVEEAKQANTNNPATDSLKSTISSLDNSKLQAINEIEKSTNPYTKLVEMIITNTDAELRSLIFKITPLLGNVNIQFTTEVSNELAKVVYADNKIVINKYAVAKNSRALEYVVAHEMLHLATLKGLTTNSEFNKNITKLYNQVKKQLGDTYALSNVREFVSEAYTNPEFKEQLKGIKYEATNVFEKFWQWIKGLFNLQDNVFNLVDKYTNQYLMNYVTDLNGNIVEDKLISDYQIEGMSLQESYNMIQSMTGIAQDIFKDADANIPVLELHKQVYNKLKERYEEAKELEDLSDNVLLMYEAILANEGDNNTFKKLLNRFDKNLVYLQNILSKEFDEADIDLEFDEEYSTVGSENYGREAFQDNPKDKASIRLKRFLAFIPDTAYNSDKTSYFTLENEFGLKQYVPYDVIYNTIVQFTANTPFNKMKSKLESIATGNSTIKVVLDKLEELRLSDKPADKLLYNEFWSNFHKQHATFATTIFQNKKSDNKNKVIYSNRKDAKFTLIDRWYTEFKNTYLTSKLVQIEDGKYKINNKVATQLREEFNKATQIKNKLEQGIAYTNILKQVGITVNKDAVELLLNQPSLFKYKTADAALERLKQATSRITLRLEEKADNKEINESNNNPFTRETKEAGENTSLEFLAEMQIYVDNNLLSSMFRNEEGKNIYSVFNNTIVSEIMTNLKDEETRETLLNNWSNSAFHKDNYLVKQLIDGTLDPKDLELVIMSTLAQDKKANSGKPYKNLTEQERQITQLINFLSKGLFQFPTLSDKPTIPFFKMKKLDVSIKDGKLNDKALDAVYSIFLQEANRIIKANNDIKNIEQKNLLIPNYHTKKANALTFMFLPQLNNLKITNNDYTYSLKEALTDVGITETIETQVKEELNKIVLDYINKTKQYYDNLGISYNGKVKEKFANDKDGSLIANFTVNNMIAKASIFTIFNNDPAYAKDIDDVSKRGAALTAPGQDLFDEEGSNFNSLIINDVVFKAKNNKNLLDYFTKLYKSEAKAKEFLKPYTELNGTDAQAYVSVKFYEDIMNKLGRDTTVYQPLKLVYAQDVWDNRTNNYIRKYIKFSAFPLFKDLTKGTQLDEFRKDMEAKGVDFVAFESASKLGTQGLQSVYKDGILLPIDINNVINLPLSGMRLQQEVPYDENKKEINVVSQARKLLFGDLLAIEGYDNITNLKDTFDTLYEANVLEAFEDLKNELGLTIQDDNYYITNVEGLKDLLSEEIVSRSNNENLLEGLELEEIDGVKRFKIPLYFSPNNQSFESLLFSLVTNGVIKQKHTGKSFVQGSEFGFYDVVTSIPKDIEDKIEWVRDNNKKSLDTFQIKDNKLEPEEILLPNIYRNILKEGQEVPTELLKVFGFRIPNQGHNSMASLKIQGFLPPEAGDLVIVTPEMLKRMGSDFDVDKLYIYFYNVKNTKDGLKKIEYLPNPKDVDRRWELYQENILKSREAKKLFGLKDKDLRKNISKFKTAIEEFKGMVNPESESDILKNALELLNVNSVEELEQEVIDILVQENRVYTYEEFKNLSVELQNSKKARQNAILDIYFEIFSNPAILEKAMMPNDIKPLVDAVNAVVPQDKQVKDILTLQTQDDYFKANLGGKTGVGITSLWNTFFSQMQYYNISIAGQGVMFKDSKGEVIRPKDEKGNYIGDDKLGLTNLSDIKGKINNSFISNILQIFQSAAVDNAKEQIMDKAGLNSETLDVAQMIAMSGIDDLELIVAFLKQPYIEKYVDFSQRIRTKFEEFEKGSYKERAIKKALNSLNNQLKDLGVETYSTFNNESVAFSKEELKEFLKFTDKNTVTFTTYNWSRYSNNSYEVSSAGDKRFSALFAKLNDGRTIEEAYQLDIKGFRSKGNDWKLGKGKAPLRNVSKEQSWNEYKDLWRTYLNENPELKEELKEKAKGKTLTDKFASTDVSQARALAEILNESEKVITLNENKIKFLQGQYQVLSNFINYKDKAEKLGKAITAYNIDTKSVGKNYYEVKQAINKYNAYFVNDNPDVPFNGLKEMGNNKFVKALYENGLLVANTAFNRPDILPFNNKFFKELYLQAAEILEKEDLSAQDIKLLNKTALWYITSMENNGIFEEDIKGLRQRLLTSTKENPSLARRIKELINEGYDNWLIQRLTIDEDKISYYRNSIEKSEEILAVIAFNQLLSDYPEIGKELIQYSYLTSGGNPTATGFSNIVPITELNKLGFGKFYNNKAFQQELDKDSFIDTFWTQYYQNNPTKAFNASDYDRQKLTDENIKFTTEKNLPKFVYLYIEQEGKQAKTILFKKNPNFEKENVYYPLALLDNEYAANQALTSINPENNKYASFPIQNTYETKESLKDKIDNLKTDIPTDLGLDINLNTKDFKC